MAEVSINKDAELETEKDSVININNVIQQKLLYLLIGLWIFLRAIDSSNIIISYPEFSATNGFISNILRISFAIYGAFLAFLSKNRLAKIACFAIYFSFAVAAYVLSNALFIFDLFFVPLFLCNALEQKKLFAVFFIAMLLAVGSVAAADYFHYINSPIVNYREGAVRYSFGFMHPNTLGFAVTILSICFVLCKRKFIIFDLAVLIGASAFCYYYPNSFTSTYILCLIAAALFVAKIANLFIKSNWFKYTLFVLSVACFISIVFFVFYHTFTDSFHEIIDKMPGAIKARFELNRVAYDRYGLSLFGTPMRIILGYHQVVLGINEPYFTVDCAYFFIMIQYGLVNLAAYLMLVVYCIWRACRNENVFGAFLCLALAVYGISETVVFGPLCMIVYAYCFYKPAKAKSRVKKQRPKRNREYSVIA